MSLRNSCIIVLAICYASRIYSRADEISNPTPFPATLRTIIRTQELTDVTSAKPLRRAMFAVGTNRFAFAIPGDFKLDASNPEKILLTSPDYSGFIAVQLLPTASTESGALIVNSFRSMALEDFPDGSVIHEFSVRAATRSGPAYELHWKNSSGAEQFAFVGFVPSKAGILKFSLLSNAEKFRENETHFRCLLRSFQSNEAGALEIRPVSGAS